MDFNRFLIGNQTIESEDQERKVLLGAYLIILYFLIDLFFFVVNLFNPEGVTWILVSGAIVSAISLLLLRKGYINLALFIYLFRANFLVYFFASQEGIETGTFLYYISYSLTPLAFYGYYDRWKGIAYALVSFVLFLITNFHSANFKPDDAHFYFILNCFFVLFTSAFIILFFDRMNKKAVVKINNQNKELLKANEELDRFVYSVSHDLRSPLASILGLVNIYGLTVSENEKLNIVEMIKGRTLKLDEFIEKILDYSRNSRREVKFEWANIYQITLEIIDALKFNAAFEKVHVDINIPKEQLLKTDPDRLKIVLSNLLSNASKYIDASKERHLVSISVHTSNSRMNITVEDNGIGIKPEHLPRIFEMFYRADQLSDGSGIGLYIVSECVHKLDGSISVQSEYGKGTIFSISLPNVVNSNVDVLSS